MKLAIKNITILQSSENYLDSIQKVNRGLSLFLLQICLDNDNKFNSTKNECPIILKLVDKFTLCQFFD